MVELVKTPDSMEQLSEIIEGMTGTQSDLALVAIMAAQLGYKQGYEAHKQETAGENR